MAVEGTLGSRLAAAPSISEVEILDRQAESPPWIRELDLAIYAIVKHILSGDGTVRFPRKRRSNPAEIQGGDEYFGAVAGALDRQAQEARGAWFLPARARVSRACIELPFHVRNHPRGAFWLSAGEPTLSLVASSTLMVWAVIQPLMMPLLLPLELRGRRLVWDSDEQLAQYWGVHTEFVSALGIDLDERGQQFRPGGGWHLLRSEGQIEARQALLTSLAESWLPTVATRYRLLRVGELVRRYYARTRDGRVEMRKVVNDPMSKKALSGFFGGDWLSFLAYLGEAPHANEQVVTALPKVRVVSPSQQRIAQVAADQGLPIDQVEQMLSAYRGGRSDAPWELRARALRRCWEKWHAAWNTKVLRGWAGPRPPYWSSGVLDKIHEAQEEVDLLWGTQTTVSRPERIVTCVTPFEFAKFAFGPALSFWEHLPRYLWEMHHARSDDDGDRLRFPDGLAQDLAQMEAAGAAIPASVFEDFLSIVRDVPLDIPAFDRKERKLLSKLRDRISAARQEWADASLDRYLQGRWEGDVRRAALSYYRLTAERGQAPTLKQFARIAVEPSNHWAGGDTSVLYGAFGEAPPIEQTRVLRAPPDRNAFLNQFSAALRSAARSSTRKDDISEAALGGLVAIQFDEMFDRPPSWNEYRAAGGGPWNLNDFLGDAGWECFSEILEGIREVLR